MKSNKKLKVFIGLNELSGFYSELQQGLVELGIDAFFADLKGHKFQYPSHNSSRLPIILQKLRHLKENNAHSNCFSKSFSFFWHKFFLAIFFLIVLIRFDVFIFSAGNSFFRLHDLPILKSLGKKIIFHFAGSEARPIYIGPYIVRKFPNTEKKLRRLALDVIAQKRKITTIEKYADMIISSPYYSQFLTKPFINCLYIGFPFNRPISKPPAKEKETIRILHAPSKPELKGTPVIRETIEKLNTFEIPIDYVEINGEPNWRVLEEIKKADIVVDQLYSDTPMAGFATEAAFFGKPAIVGGYGWSWLGKLLPEGQIPPSKLCHPDEIETAIVHLIKNGNYRKKLGKAAQEFVLSQWERKSVAKRFLQIIEHHAPVDWYYDPFEIDYFHGACVSEKTLKAALSKFVARYGKDALQLSDKPKLEQKFYSLIN